MIQAAQWLRKAAEQGNAKAQYNLGEMYHIGQGVRQDLHLSRNGSVKHVMVEFKKPATNTAI